MTKTVLGEVELLSIVHLGLEGLFQIDYAILSLETLSR